MIIFYKHTELMYSYYLYVCLYEGPVYLLVFPARARPQRCGGWSADEPVTSAARVS